MNVTGTNINAVSIGRFLSVCLMVACLTLLTSMNFFLYSSAEDTGFLLAASGSEDCKNNFPPSGPTEEKSGNSGFSFSEEILHEAHAEFNFSALDHLYLHHIAEADNIEMFHPERVLPPPKL